jgi:hypothetical protein
MGIEEGEEVQGKGICNIFNKIITENSPSKDTVWQTGLKRKIQQSFVYRRPISLTETSTGLG